MVADLYTRLCAALSKLCLAVAVLLLILVILAVQYQVVGRYVFNDTPTWAEALALLLVLYVTAFGAAVGVRDANHVGFDNVVQMFPQRMQKGLVILSHALVALFGVLMAYGGWIWAQAKWTERKPMLGVPDAVDYIPLVIAGVLIVMFAIEHIVAKVRGTTVVPAWH